MMNECADNACGALVDVDPWHAWPDVFAGVPVLCDQHIQPHEEIIKARFAARRATGGIMPGGDS